MTRLVLAQSVRVAVAGVAIGMSIALAAGRAREPLLFRQSARDPVVLGGVAALLVVAAIVAGIAPVYRVLGIDPMVALTQE